MPTQATYIGVTPRSVKVGGVAVGRALRVTRTAGVVALSPIGTRGDFITLEDGEANQPVMVSSIQKGGKLPVVASEAAAVDDPAYSAANGQVSKTAAGAIYMGKWTAAASGAGVIGEIELANPA